MLRKCVNCGKIIGETSNHNNHSVTGTFCETCWELYEDSKKYKKLGLIDLSNYLRVILKARKSMAERR